MSYRVVLYAILGEGTDCVLVVREIKLPFIPVVGMELRWVAHGHRKGEPLAFQVMHVRWLNDLTHIEAQVDLPAAADAPRAERVQLWADLGFSALPELPSMQPQLPSPRKWSTPQLARIYAYDQIGRLVGSFRQEGALWF